MDKSPSNQRPNPPPKVKRSRQKLVDADADADAVEIGKGDPFKDNHLGQMREQAES